MREEERERERFEYDGWGNVKDAHALIVQTDSNTMLRSLVCFSALWQVYNDAWGCALHAGWGLVKRLAYKVEQEIGRAHV